MPRVSLTLLGGLSELLPREPPGPIAVPAPEGATAGSILEDLGIPHTEVGGLAVNRLPGSLASRPTEGDEIAAWPIGTDIDGGAEPPRFVLDVHLGRLARLLRLLGFDAVWSSDATDGELSETAGRGDRILLSRDRGLLKRRDVRRGCLVRSQVPRLQLIQVADRYGLSGRIAPFSRCLVCNTPLDRDAGTAAGPDGGSTGGCPSCGRRYWRGSHWRSLNRIVEQVRTPAPGAESG